MFTGRKYSAFAYYCYQIVDEYLHFSKEANQLYLNILGIEGWKRGLPPIKEQIEARTKEEIRENLLSQGALMKVYHILKEKEVMTAKELCAALGYEDIDSISGTPEEAAIEFANGGATRSYYSFWEPKRSWLSKTNRKISLDWVIELFMDETLRDEPSWPEAVGYRRADFCDYAQVDGFLDHFRTPRRSGSSLYEEIRRAKETDYHGKSTLDHMMAEDYGFQKDKLALGMVAVFGHSRGDIYCKGYERDAKGLVEAWIENDTFPVEGDYYLPNLKISRTQVKNDVDHLLLEPYYRKTLVEILRHLAVGSWYSAASIWDCYKTNTAIIGFNGITDVMEYANPKLEDFYDGKDDGDRNWNDRLMSRAEELSRRPLVYGMLYTLALFGVLAISEKDPPKPCRKGARTWQPYSPFDCLDAVSLTEYGAWVLGVREDKPQIEKDFEEPIADKDLLLVTYKGKNIDVKEYLAKIAKPISSIRWRVDLVSFTEGCSSLKQIDERIDQFKEWISQEPPANWLSFFDRARGTYTFTERVDDGSLIRINNRALFDQLMRTTELRELVIFAEGGLVFLPNGNRKRFNALMERQGIRAPISAKNSSNAKQ